ncbi:hypothetical protein [Streptacidiphilus carbonis]|uniref:hypothetical protein n=1 Tax=Streptacidiphilus carbonis TaxID=105422 RepID=UPI0005A5F300|nr:hypothetical protein [Streptacidiphilus carbonis]
MGREFNALAVVRDRIGAQTISRRLAAVRSRSQKLGFGRAFQASPRSVGFRVAQEGPFKVQVRWRAGADDDPAATEDAYAALAQQLVADGYDTERHPGPGPNTGTLVVTRKREPTAAEWAALETVAPHPLDCTRDGAAAGVPAETAQSLVWSGLLEVVKYPLVRHHVYDPHQGTLLALSTDGRQLLERRIEHQGWERERAARDVAGRNPASL